MAVKQYKCTNVAGNCPQRGKIVVPPIEEIKPVCSQCGSGLDPFDPPTNLLKHIWDFVKKYYLIIVIALVCVGSSIAIYSYINNNHSKKEPVDITYKKYFEERLLKGQGKKFEITEKERKDLDNEASRLKISAGNQAGFEEEVLKAIYCKLPENEKVVFELYQPKANQGWCNGKPGKPSFVFPSVNIIIMDNSVSVKNYLSEIKQTAEGIISDLKELDRVAVITLDGTAPGPARDIKSSKGSLLNDISRTSITEKWSDFKVPFEKAAALIKEDSPAQGKEFRIYFLSDGKYEPENGAYDYGLKGQEALAQSLVLYEKLKNEIKFLEKTGVHIYTIATGDNPDAFILQKLAKDFGGEYYASPSNFRGRTQPKKEGK
jgi:hypothetical protein